MSIDWFIHAANVLYLISYLVKEIFLLRFITVFATLTLVPFYLFQGKDPLWAPIVWAGIFTVVNVYQIYLLFKERRPVVLSPEDDELYQLSFSAFTIKQFAKILKSSRRKTIQNGETIANSGETVNQIIFITKGTALVKNDETVIASFKEGDLVADVNLITESPLNHVIKSDADSHVIYWDKLEFEKLLAKDDQLNSSWQSLISGLLAKKLMKTNQ